jgi:hypothetical protein
VRQPILQACRRYPPRLLTGQRQTQSCHPPKSYARVGQRIDGISPSIDQAASAAVPADWTIAIDGGFVSCVGQGELSNFEILTLKTCVRQHKTLCFCLGRSQATGAAERVSTLVRARTGHKAPKLRMVTDGANNTLSIRQGLPFPATPILDWFHISMKIRHVEQIVQGLRPRTETERSTKNLLAADLAKYVGVSGTTMRESSTKSCARFC